MNRLRGDFTFLYVLEIRKLLMLPLLLFAVQSVFLQVSFPPLALSFLQKCKGMRDFIERNSTFESILVFFLKNDEKCLLCFGMQVKATSTDGIGPRYKTDFLFIYIYFLSF